MGTQTLTSPVITAASVAGEPGACSRGLSVVFNYRARSHAAQVDLALIDLLADALEELPATMQMRVVKEIGESSDTACWMMVCGLTPGRQEELVTIFARLGAELRRSPLPLLGFDETSHAVVRVREGGSVTRPGMTRELTRWLIERGHVAHLIFDYKHTSTVGLARYDLAFVMRDLAHVTGPFSEEVAEVMSSDTTTYRRQQATAFLKRLRSWTLSRPQLDACTGNIADLFPL